MLLLTLCLLLSGCHSGWLNPAETILDRCNFVLCSLSLVCTRTDVYAGLDPHDAASVHKGVALPDRASDFVPRSLDSRASRMQREREPRPLQQTMYLRYLCGYRSRPSPNRYEAEIRDTIVRRLQQRQIHELTRILWHRRLLRSLRLRLNRRMVMLRVPDHQFPETCCGSISDTVHRTFASSAAPVLLAGFLGEVMRVSLYAVAIAGELDPGFLASGVGFGTHDDEFIALGGREDVAAGEEFVDGHEGALFGGCHAM